MCYDLYIENWKKYMDETEPGWNKSYMDEENLYFNDEDLDLLNDEMENYYGD